MQICMPWERSLFTWMITSARGHSQLVLITSQEDWGTCDVILYLVHHASWAITHCAPKCSWFPCQPVETHSSSRFRTPVSWLLPELLDKFGSNKLPGFFCCLLDGNQLILHFDLIGCDSSHLTLNVITDIGFIYGWCGIGTSDFSVFEMRKLHVSFKKWSRSDCLSYHTDGPVNCSRKIHTEEGVG